MPEFSHEDIKNAILHANDGAPESPSVDTPDQPDILPEVPHTPYEGFEAKPPTEVEKVGFLAAKDQVHARHRSRRKQVEPEIATGTPKRRRGVAIAAAGAVATAVIGGLGAVKLLNETAAEDIPPRETPTSQSDEIKELETGPVTIENINTRSTEAQLELAEQPVTAREHPKPKDAFQALIDRRQTYTNGARIDFEQTPAEETPESIASGERLLTTIYGPGYESRPNFDNTQGEELRRRLGIEFAYLYDSREELGTFRLNSEIQSVESTYIPEAKKAFTIRSSDIVETNIYELDPSQTLFDGPDDNVPRERDTVIFLAPDGNWYIYGTIELE